MPDYGGGRDSQTLTKPIGGEIQNDRESIWSVSKGTKNVYFIVFAVLMVLGASLLTWQELSNENAKDSLDTFLTIWAALAPIAIAAAAVAMVLTEGGGIVFGYSQVVLDKARKLREKRREEGRREGREEILTALRAWHQRRKAAEKEGKKFDEPIPFLEDGNPD